MRNIILHFYLTREGYLCQLDTVIEDRFDLRQLMQRISDWNTVAVIKATPTSSNGEVTFTFTNFNAEEEYNNLPERFQETPTKVDTSALLTSLLGD